MFLHEKAFERSGRQIASQYISFHYIVFIQHLNNTIVFHFDLIPDKKKTASCTRDTEIVPTTFLFVKLTSIILRF